MLVLALMLLVLLVVLVVCWAAGQRILNILCCQTFKSLLCDLFFLLVWPAAAKALKRTFVIVPTAPKQPGEAKQITKNVT
jgi:hypothetical protein